VPRSLGPFTSQPLQPRTAPPLEALLEETVPLRAPTLDPGASLPIGALLLGPASLQALLERLAAAAERDYVSLPPSEAPWLNRPPPHTSIGNVIVPCEPHLVGGSAAAEAL
jgi:hypothetical protein